MFSVNAHLVNKTKKSEKEKFREVPYHVSNFLSREPKVASTSLQTQIEECVPIYGMPHYLGV